MTRLSPTPAARLRFKMESFAVYALTQQGAELATKATKALAGARLFLPARLSTEFKARPFDRLGQVLAENFMKYPGHIVVGATGMVVRLIAPLLVSKKDDPAVVTVGQDGRFVISLLSGHLGGANQLATQVAEILGAQAVLNTATDIEGCPAIEVLASELDLTIDDFARLAPVSRSLVEGNAVKVCDPHLFLTPHLAPWPECFDINGPAAPKKGEPHIRVDFRVQPQDRAALTLRPKALAIGLGCHRGIDPAEVAALIQRCLAEAGLSPNSIAVLATVETRAKEPAFLEISQTFGWPLKIFTKAELAEISAPNPSEKVLERIGVPSVCEAAAMLAAKSRSLIISKHKSARATLAAALLDWK